MNAVLSLRIINMSPQLLASDIEKSIEFYIQNLGFEVSFRYEDFYAGIVRDWYSIHLKSSDIKAIKEKQKRKSADDIDIVFSVDGIEDLYESITGKQVEVIQPILREMSYGKEFYIADPDSYIISFTEEK